MAPKHAKKRMYAVSKDGVGLIAGTLAYSRGAAIDHFIHGTNVGWEQFKRAGYRTVRALVEVTDRFGVVRRRTRP